MEFVKPNQNDINNLEGVTITIKEDRGSRNTSNELLMVMKNQSEGNSTDHVIELIKEGIIGDSTQQGLGIKENKGLMKSDHALETILGTEPDVGIAPINNIRDFKQVDYSINNPVPADVNPDTAELALEHALETMIGVDPALGEHALEIIRPFDLGSTEHELESIKPQDVNPGEHNLETIHQGEVGPSEHELETIKPKDVNPGDHALETIHEGDPEVQEHQLETIKPKDAELQEHALETIHSGDPDEQVHELETIKPKDPELKDHSLETISIDKGTNPNPVDQYESGTTINPEGAEDVKPDLVENDDVHALETIKDGDPESKEHALENMIGIDPESQEHELETLKDGITGDSEHELESIKDGESGDTNHDLENIHEGDVEVPEHALESMIGEDAPVKSHDLESMIGEDAVEQLHDLERMKGKDANPQSHQLETMIGTPPDESNHEDESMASDQGEGKTESKLLRIKDENKIDDQYKAHSPKKGTQSQIAPDVAGDVDTPLDNKQNIIASKGGEVRYDNTTTKRSTVAEWGQVPFVGDVIGLATGAYNKIADTIDAVLHDKRYQVYLACEALGNLMQDKIYGTGSMSPTQALQYLNMMRLYAERGITVGALANAVKSLLKGQKPKFKFGPLNLADMTGDNDTQEWNYGAELAKGAVTGVEDIYYYRKDGTWKAPLQGYKDIAGFSLDSSHLWDLSIQRNKDGNDGYCVVPPTPSSSLGMYADHFEPGWVPALSYDFTDIKAEDKDIDMPKGYSNMKIVNNLTKIGDFSMMLVDNQLGEWGEWLRIISKISGSLQDSYATPYKHLTYVFTLYVLDRGSVQNRAQIHARYVRRMICKLVDYEVRLTGEEDPQIVTYNTNWQVLGELDDQKEAQEKVKVSDGIRYT